MAVAALAFLQDASFWISVGILAAIYGITGLGVQLNVGTTGIMNFGPVGFMAIGAYTMAVLVVQESLPLWLGLICGIAFAVVPAVLVGLPALRLRADYFAITTLAFAEIVRYVVVDRQSLTKGNQGIYGFDAGWQHASGTISTWFARIGIHGGYLVPLLAVSWATFLVLALALRLITRTPWGRVLNAIRADEDAARALGKNTLVYKLQSLALSAAVCAIAGYLLAFNLALLVPDVFDSTVTIYAYTIVILGGLGSYVGVLIGSFILITILEGTSYLNVPLAPDRVAALRFIIVGLILIAIVAFRPRGLLGKREEMVTHE